MKKRISLVTFCLILLALTSEAQYFPGRIRPPRYRRSYPRQVQPRQQLPKFQPTVNLSIGYGFPNLDKNELAQFYNAYQGTSAQKGPITGAFDYQFSRYMSIGVMGTYGKVTAPYYDYSSSSATPSFTGSLENWSVMLNMVNYIPTYNNHVNPYFRTAIGINNWKQNYLDETGAKAAIVDDPSQFAYQASLGARFNLSKQAGFYLEVGYGKYILNGGLTLRF